MVENECGDEVPDSIVSKAREAGCANCPQYVYRDGKYGGKLPAASIGYKPRAVRLRSQKQVDKSKVDLGDGWVAFRRLTPAVRNPYGSGRRSEGKGRCEPCIICGEDRDTADAHFPTPQRKGGTKVIPLCPTHHKLLDNGRLSLAEMQLIWQSRYPDFKSFEKFMRWAYDKGYPYSIEDIRSKKLWKDFDEKDVSYRISNSQT